MNFNKTNIQNNISNNVVNIVDKYINKFRKIIHIKLPTQKKELIKWDFKISNLSDKNEVKYGYVKNFDNTYKKYFMMEQDDNIRRFRFDLDYISNIVRSPYYNKILFDFLMKYYKIFNNNEILEQKIKILENMFNFYNNVNRHREEYFKFLINKCKSSNKNNKNKKIKLFQIITYLNPDILSVNDLSYINSTIKYKININIPIRNNVYSSQLKSITKNSINKYKQYNNKMAFKYLLIDDNLFDFNKIIEFSKFYNNNVDFIYLKLGYRLTKYSFDTINTNITLWLNMLYLIFKMQNNNGTLILTNIVFSDQTHLEFIYILNNFYDKIVLTNFEEVRGISICCYGFRGITKDELNNFYKSYYKVYNEIKNSRKINMSINKKEKNKLITKQVKQVNDVQTKFINKICSNKINKSIIKCYKEYNSYFMKNLIFVTDTTEKINDLFDNSNDEIKKYIFLKIFEKQYKRYIDYTNFLENQLNNFYNVCQLNS